jgi:para-nitrobenzyl esterase
LRELGHDGLKNQDSRFAAFYRAIDSVRRTRKTHKESGGKSRGDEMTGRTLFTALALTWLTLSVGARAQTPPQTQDPAQVQAQTIAVDGGRIAVPASVNGIRVYKGLPYAAPPTGERRWRAPAAVLPWSGVRPVDRFGPNCLQPKVYLDTDPFTPSMAEDCLYLNVWTGAAADAKRPVIFWIHGGGYIAGSGGAPRTDGTVLARKGVIVVTINYRLGVFGFLAHPDLTAESPHHASGNYALMDMIAALEWVHRNIAKFGGDPANVTIAGESAGSDAVSRLMASPQAHGLFARAIGESGSAFGTMGPDETLAQGEANGEAFTKAMGVSSIDALRKRSSAEILALETSPILHWNFHPITDGWILPQPVRAIFAAGKQNDVPLLLGWNAQEGTLFQSALQGRSLPDALKATFGARDAEAASFYPLATPDETADSLVRLAGDIVIAQPTWSWATAQARSGHAPVYLYRFDRAPPVPDDWFGDAFKGKKVGAFHSGEIVYAFGHPGIIPSWAVTDTDRHIGDLMSSYWAAFAAAGNPNGDARPIWPAYDPANAQRMIFDAQPHTGPVSGQARHEFLEKVGLY